MGEITKLLALWHGGDREALHRLTPLVYEHLRMVAGRYMRHEDAGHPLLRPTELINELFLDLLRLKRLAIEDRNHFFALSARLMRQILIKHARSRTAEKRGGRAENLPLDDELNWSGASLDVSRPEVLDLNSAMDELELYDESALRAVELRYFFGFTAEETAESLGVSKATVDRHIRFALSWLHSRLHSQPRKS